VTVRASRFKINAEGMDRVVLAVAEGLNEFALEVAAGVRREAPKGTPGNPRPLRTNRGGSYSFHGRHGGPKYRNTIHATTFMRGEHFKGPRVRDVGRARHDVRSVVFSDSFTAHMLELGVAPHEIPIPHATQGAVTTASGPADLGVVAYHPGSKRYPHFWPGFASSLQSGLARMSARGIAVTRARGRISGGAAGPELFEGSF
jgi:hypothetical protein